MKKLGILTSFLFSLLALVSCENSFVEPLLEQTPPAVAPPPIPSASPTVYVVGAGTPIAGNSAFLWTNQTLSTLSHPDGPEAGASYIRKVGSDTHIAGGEYNGPLSKMAYWKNGTFMYGGAYPSDAWGMGMVGSDVYISGIESNKACYWKNGVRTYLPGSAFSNAYGMAVSGTDVYIAGFIFPGGGVQPVYWKNGVMVPLNAPAGLGDATSIAVRGTDVYVGGQDNTGTFGYWKNGVMNPLPGSGDLVFWSILFAANGDMYVGGMETVAGARQACFWKNGVKTNINGTATSSEIIGGYAHGNDIYFVGYRRSGTSSTSILWKNGVSQDLPGVGGTASDVIVAP